jgi:hypothetical protein
MEQENMTKNKGDGGRALLGRSYGKHTEITDAGWKRLKDIIGTDVPENARNEINEANAAFSKYGPLHSIKNTASVKITKKKIDSWRLRTDKLRSALGSNSRPAVESREEIISKWRSKKSKKRLLKMMPLEFLAFALECAIDAEQHALSELEQGNVAVKYDLWSAWVCLIAKTLGTLNVKLSAASKNKDKNDRGSPFINAIEFLQGQLPQECRVFLGYETIRKNVLNARRAMGQCSELFLLIILTVWGSRTMRAPIVLSKQIGMSHLTFSLDPNAAPIKI